jgi:hypothetical protein
MSQNDPKAKSRCAGMIEVENAAQHGLSFAGNHFVAAILAVAEAGRK